MRLLMTLDNVPDDFKKRVSHYFKLEGDDVTFPGSLADLVGKIRNATIDVGDYGAVLSIIGIVEHPPDKKGWDENICYLRQECRSKRVQFAYVPAFGADRRIQAAFRT